MKDLQKTMAGGLGFEPRFSDPKSDVLPLDDPPTGLHDKAFFEYVFLSQVRQGPAALLDY